MSCKSKMTTIKKVDITQVVKLDGTNFQRWKLQISLVLKASELWDVVSGTDTKPADATKVAEIKAWVKKDVEAQALIVPTLDAKQTSHIFNLATSKEIFDKLQAVNSDSSNLNKQHTLSSFLNYIIGPSKSILDAYVEMEQLARSLNEMGVTIDDTTLITKIVSSLPDDKFLAFKKAWDSVPENDQTMEMLLARLRKEELEFKQKAATASNSESSDSSAYLTKHKNHSKGFKKQNIEELKKKTKCKKCNKVGHWAKECRSKFAQNGAQASQHVSQHGESQTSDIGAFMCYSASSQLSTEWISDSGATQHITGIQSWFVEYTQFDTSVPVSLSNQKKAYALGSGTVQLEGLVNNEWITCTLKNVLYIPGSVNLFSETIMAQKGYVIIRDKTKTTFTLNDIPGPVAVFKGKLYIMEFRPTEAMALSLKGANMSKIWHERLSHINMSYIKNTIGKHAAIGINENDLKDDFDCDICHIGKEARKPFPRRAATRSTLPGEMIHADIAGKMPMPSLGGSSFFLLLKDDYSGFRTVYFLKHKSDTPRLVQQFIKFLERQTGNKLKAFRSDNGTEFTNSTLQEFFKQNGIIHETTVPYCPESNGRAEREIRTIKDSARSLLHQHNVPEFLWAEAVATVVYIHNRVLDKQSPDKTAFEQIFGKKPSLDHARTFGCKAYSQVPTEKRRVWDPKGIKCIMVGYDSKSNHYRLYNPERKAVFVARNVSFEEEIKDGYSRIEYLSDEEGIYAPTNSPSASPEREIKPTQSTSTDTTVLIDTETGKYRATIPKEGKVKILIPKSDRTLRDRGSIKTPDRYQANMASTIDEPSSYSEALKSPIVNKWKEAMNEEIQSHKQNKTWTLVPKPNDAKILDSRWVFKIKPNPDGTNRYKARLVIKGYRQTQGIDYTETFSSVCRYESIRLLLAIAASYYFTIKQFDIKTAFLYGSLQETVYMHQPEGITNEDENLVCLLNKSLYGLKQAPRCWNQTFSSFLEDFNFLPSSSDPSVYIGECDEDKVYLLLYVDDGLVLSHSTTAIEQFLCQIKQKFEVKISDPTNFVGIEIQQEHDGSLVLTQKAYIASILKRFCMEECKQSSVPMQPNTNLELAKVADEKYPYRELIGSLIFLARTTRIDIAFATSRMAQFCNNYSEQHWTEAKKILRYLKGTADLGIKYKRSNNLEMRGFSDSDYAGDKIERKSVTGYVFLLNGAPISWCSQKQQIVALSSTEAEYVALTATAKEAVWLQKLTSELGHEVQRPLPLFVDNQSAIKLAHNPEFHNRSKHIDVKYHFTRNLIQQGDISVDYVPTDKQAADCLTKPLLKTKFEEMKQLIGINANVEPKINHTALYSKPRFRVWPIIIGMLSLLTLTHAIGLQNSQPVLWRTSNIPITTGHKRVYLKIILINPCEILNSEILHADVTEKAKMKCDEMYNNYLLNHLEEMCPKNHLPDVFRTKRELVTLLVGIIIATVVVPVTLGATAVGLSASNSGSIKEIEAAFNDQAKITNDLHQKINAVKLAVQYLREDFNTLVDRVEAQDKDFLELKFKQTGTNFAISYLVFRLMNAKHVLKNAKREWKMGKLSPAFMDIFNYTLPCGEDCPMELAKPNFCRLSDNRTELYMDFDVPIINRTLQLLEADPFQLMERVNNKTCSIKYIGPTNVITSTENKCSVSLNLPNPRRDLILAPLQGCMPQAIISKETKYFDVERCTATHDHDQLQFIQIKPLHGFHHIYCPYSTFHLDNQNLPCPNTVFVMPATTNFKINNFQYNGSQLYVTHKTSVDPLFTTKTNWNLQPKYNFSDLKKHPRILENTVDTISNVKTLKLDHPTAITIGTAIFIVITILVVIIGIILYKYRTKARVVMAERILPESLEMEETA